VLGPGETGVSLQARASRLAMDLAGVRPEQIDLVLSSAFFPDLPDVGNATYIAKELNLGCAAWNLESACAGSVLAYETAAALVSSGVHRNVLVSVICTYSSVTPDSDSLSWWLGDAAAAFVVSPTAPGRGYIAGHTINTAETCGCFFHELGEVNGTRRYLMKASPSAGSALRATAAQYLTTCCEGAARKAGVRLSDIDFFVFNTPTAWYAKYCARTLGIDPERCIDMYPYYGNIGPALMPINLYHAAKAGRLKDNDLVLFYAVGSSSSASAVISRWSDIQLGASGHLPECSAARSG
jgi:3-oxoacyl-[acyl-carrier-protein] synthase-3